MAPVKLRPSAAHKWVNCHGSVRMEEGRPQGDTSAADEGTVAHWIAAKVLTSQSVPEFDTQWQVVDSEVYPAVADFPEPIITFTEEMLEHVMKYVDAVQLGTQNGDHVIIETEVDLSGLLGEGAAGTPDFMRVRGGCIEIHDLKYGYTPIDAAGNLQLACYAYGAYQAYGQAKAPRFTLAIHQPRLNSVDIVDYSFDDMLSLWSTIGKATMSANSKNAPLTAGAWCHKHYCKAQAVCPAYQEYVLEDMPDELTDSIVVGDAIIGNEVTRSREDAENVMLSSKLSKIEAIRKWCDAIESEAYRLAVEEGKRIPGYKVVEGRGGNRKWRDDKEAEELMRTMRIKHEHMYKYSVVSPTQAEKLAKAGSIGKRQWPRLKNLITRADGKLQLVAESDKRPAVDVKPLLEDMPIEPEFVDDLI